MAKELSPKELNKLKHSDVKDTKDNYDPYGPGAIPTAIYHNLLDQKDPKYKSIKDRNG